MNLGQKKAWFSKLEDLSVPFQKYRSFLPEQRELLERIYKLRRSEKRVLIFVAPPASGKTHVICLLARILVEVNQRTAILVPSNHLKEQFKRALSEVRGGLPAIDVLNTVEYLKAKEEYDYVLADEAHNLKSFLELDPSLVKSVSLSADDPFYSHVANRYLSPQKTFVAQQLSFPSARDLLDTFKHVPKFSSYLREVTKDPTSWSCFIYLWREPGVCTVRFVKADGLCRLKLPRKRLLMFSATPLSNRELDFYCGIAGNIIERATPVKSAAKSREKQRVCISVTDELTLDRKIDLLMCLIRESKTRILVLFNSLRSCQNAFASLKRKQRNVFIIPRAAAPRGVYREFLCYDDAVLLTSSTVFWEGMTVAGLRLVIIAEPPFPRPNLVELVKRKVVDGRRDMVRRLQQGLARVGRREGEFGVAIMLFDIGALCKGTREVTGRSRLLRMGAWDCPILLHKLFVDRSLSIESLR